MLSNGHTGSVSGTPMSGPPTHSVMANTGSNGEGGARRGGSNAKSGPGTAVMVGGAVCEALGKTDEGAAVGGSEGAGEEESDVPDGVDGCCDVGEAGS